MSNQIEKFCQDTVQIASWMCDICQIKSLIFIGAFYKRPELWLIFVARVNYFCRDIVQDRIMADICSIYSTWALACKICVLVKE